jgi:hypothetical protein
MRSVSSHESATFRGGAATFAGGWPDYLQGEAFCIFQPLAVLCRTLDAHRNRTARAVASFVSDQYV